MDIERARRFLIHIIPKLRSEGAASLEDTELRRCFAGCVAPTALFQAAQVLRESGELSVKHLTATGG